MRQLSYDGLWKKLIDFKMTKKDLKKQTKVSTSTIAKMTQNKIVSLEILLRLCEYFDCDIEDLVSYRKEIENKEKLIEGLETLKQICDDQNKTKLSKVLQQSILELKNKWKEVEDEKKWNFKKNTARRVSNLEIARKAQWTKHRAWIYW